VIADFLIKTGKVFKAFIVTKFPYLSAVNRREEDRGEKILSD